MSAAAEPRYRYLDGLRGVAALQVLLSHYANAFLPAASVLFFAPPPALRWQVPIGRSPLYVLIDGYTAVDLFFVLSGFVLRGSFMGMRGTGAALWRRLLRLGLPAMAAACLAIAVTLAGRGVHLQAARISGSDWLGSMVTPAPDLAHLAREVFLNSMLLGYAGVSVFSPWLGLPALGSSYDPPLWTLNVELAGSLLCLLLVVLHRLHPLLSLCVGLAVLACGLKTSLHLFVIGFWLGGCYPRRQAPWSVPAGLVCLAGGLWLSRLAPPAGLVWLDHRLAGRLPDPFQLGAILLFFAVLNLPVLQGLLETRPVRWLGRVSFGLYLTHLPVLLTLGCAVFVLAAPRLGICGGTAVSLGVGLAGSLPLALLFTRAVDGPAIRLSRRATGFPIPWRPA